VVDKNRLTILIRRFSTLQASLDEYTLNINLQEELLDFFYLNPTGLATQLKRKRYLYGIWER
jgi:hypothetical protein